MRTGLEDCGGDYGDYVEHRCFVANGESSTTAIDHIDAELDWQITLSNRHRQTTPKSALTGEAS
jgi:hypothetical protein